MQVRLIQLVSLGLLVGACMPSQILGLPKTPGEQSTNYGYVPLDPLAVDQKSDADSCKEAKGSALESVPLLEALPDLAVRFAVADVDASGGLTFGPSKITTEGGNYRAVLDYVNVDAVPVDFLVRKLVLRPDREPRYELPSTRVERANGEYVLKYDVHYIDAASPAAVAPSDSFEFVTIPIYIGVGLRLSADIRSIKGNIGLSGLGVIGAQAEAKALSGTLTVQTLGVNGPALATALPLPNKLDQTTIENGILALGSSRAMLYTAGVSGTSGERIIATPRVVGLYSPIGSDPMLINAVYAELSRIRPQWNRPCRPKGTPAKAAEIVSPPQSFTIEGKPKL